MILGFLSRIQTDGGNKCMSSRINNLFSKIKIINGFATPYDPESNKMAEQLIRSLKYRLNHVNKDQVFNLQRSLNIAVSAYQMVPYRATNFSPFEILYGCEAITP